MEKRTRGRIELARRDSPLAQLSMFQSCSPSQSVIDHSCGSSQMATFVDGPELLSRNPDRPLRTMREPHHAVLRVVSRASTITALRGKLKDENVFFLHPVIFSRAANERNMLAPACSPFCSRSSAVLFAFGAQISRHTRADDAPESASSPGSQRGPTAPSEKAPLFHSPTLTPIVPFPCPPSRFLPPQSTNGLDGRPSAAEPDPRQPKHPKRHSDGKNGQRKKQYQRQRE